MANANHTTELWKPAPGFEAGYLVSNRGRVWSFPFEYERKEWRHGRKQSVEVGGNYLSGHVRRTNGRPVCVLLTMRDNSGKKKTVRLHKLVALAFLGEPTGRQICCHNDGDPTNNHVSNLRWDDWKGNQLDSKKHGTKVDPPTIYGEKHHAATISDQDVDYIRSLTYYRGMYTRLAERYGTSSQTIKRIYTGTSRNHGPRPNCSGPSPS